MLVGMITFQGSLITFWDQVSLSVGLLHNECWKSNLPKNLGMGQTLPLLGNARILKQLFNYSFSIGSMRRSRQYFWTTTQSCSRRTRTETEWLEACAKSTPSGQASLKKASKSEALRLLFGFVSDSAFVKLNQNYHKY